MLLPKGVDDFRELVEEDELEGGYLYIDKTLNLSMLHYFFAPEVDEIPTAGLFDGLKISQHKNCMRQ